MKVSKIFMILIIVVACIMLGALVLNVLFPNVAKTMCNAIEDGIFKATGMKFDFNGDGTKGGDTTNGEYIGTEQAGKEEGASGNNVDGFA